MLNNKRILLGVTGGIAAYKACDLASKLTQAGAEVRVIMTESATKFVSPLTFQALTRQEVYTDTFAEKDPAKISHIDVADWAEIAIIAPATANIISTMANGLGTDMLSTTMLATRATVYIAPAMNVHMYDHPAVIQNMKQLEKWGYHFIEPGSGYLACGYVGKGRLEEPLTIIEVIKNHQQEKQVLTGKKVLVSAGPTRETLDPVRFFTNRSSGKMGFALAETAANLGAEVTLVSGPVVQTIQHPHIHRVDVTSAAEMYEAMHQYFPENDIVVKAAAVADYRPKVVYDEKMKKSDGDLTITMERTKDILQSLGQVKKDQFLVGFAAETSNALQNGKKKLHQKNLDAIVINDVAEEGAGFEVDTNKVVYMSKRGNTIDLPFGSKMSVANAIFTEIVQEMKGED